MLRSNLQNNLPSNLPSNPLSGVYFHVAANGVEAYVTWLDVADGRGRLSQVEGQSLVPGGKQPFAETSHEDHPERQGRHRRQRSDHHAVGQKLAAVSSKSRQGSAGVLSSRRVVHDAVVDVGDRAQLPARAQPSSASGVAGRRGQAGGQVRVLWEWPPTLLPLIDVLHEHSSLQQVARAVLLAEDDDEGGLLGLTRATVPA